MHFCSDCGNMYYVKLSSLDENKLMYYCRKCGKEDNSISQQEIVVSKTVIHKNNANFNQFMNEYTKLDPSLPRIKNIECPNTECPVYDKEDPKEQEVIYIRYDNVNLKYIYLCSHCEHVWNVTNS